VPFAAKPPRSLPVARALLIVGPALFTGFGVAAHAQAGAKYWISAGVGDGIASFSCRYDACRQSPDGHAVEEFVGLGFRAGGHARTGAEVTHWSRSGVGFTSLSLVMAYDLGVISHLVVRTGAGYAWVNGRATSDGLSFFVGLGLEAAVTDQISAGPMVTYRRRVLDPVHPQYVPEGTGWRESLWVLGVAVTLRR
jgi:hypothetical protein